LDERDKSFTRPAAPIDSSHDILRRRGQPLCCFFAPRSVAVVEAAESAGDLGRTVLWNLVRHPFGGTVFPVSRSHASVLGIKAYPALKAAPANVELAIITAPALTVPDLVSECIACGVKCATIISGGFRECGPQGAALEAETLRRARAGGLRLLGPNCLGTMSPVTGLNASSASAMARPGSVGFISQSGALATAVLDWSLKEMVGFSHFISVGSMIDVGWGDLIDYLSDDPHTRSILIYMESVGDARAFLSAAREVALAKPVIVIKAGRTVAAAKAAASHTGALTGSDEVLDAAFRRCGVLRVGSIADLFYMAEVLSRQPRPKGPRLCIVTNAGGPGVLATDALITSGGELAELSAETVAELNRILPSQWSHGNPVDILGDAPPERYGQSVEALARDSLNDGILVILAPQAMTEPTRTAELMRPFARLEGKPILASWMGGVEVSEGERILNRADIPTFPYPDTAARAFQYMWRYSYNLRGIYETPYAADGADYNPARQAEVEAMVQQVRGTGRSLLTEPESKKVLATYGIPVVETRVAETEAEAARYAEEFGYPVVLKIHSRTIAHKSDADGVRLNLHDAEAVRRAFRSIREAVARIAEAVFEGVSVQPMVEEDGYEIIIGSSLDLQFGPVLLFGAGGRLAEVYKDRALALPPLNTTLARRMIEQTRIHQALKSGRRHVDYAALETLLVRFSRLVAEQRWIREIDVNPLLVAAGGCKALDARIFLYDPEVLPGSLPGLAIRPYPVQYAGSWTMKDGTEVVIRPIRPEDEPLMVRFHETLSDLSVYYRYFHAMRLTQRVAHERLVRMCFIDYSREMALVADCRDPGTGIHELLGVGRLIRAHGSPEAEFAIIVSDSRQRSGLGTELLRRLVEVARREGVEKVAGDILPDNSGMLRVCEKLGFRPQYSMEQGVVRAEIDLGPAPEGASNRNA